MSTTNLFVELVVIGIGVLIWIALIVIAVAGISWFPTDDAFLVIAALPSVALIYVLGIVWDRFADAVFSSMWTDVLKAEQYSDGGNYYDDRRIILIQSEALSELLEYGRSRLRICRGWTLNAFFIALSLIPLLVLESDFEIPATLVVVCMIIFLLLSAGCWLAWRSLSKAEYRKIREQSEYLAKIRANE